MNFIQEKTRLELIKRHRHTGNCSFYLRIRRKNKKKGLTLLINAGRNPLYNLLIMDETKKRCRIKKRGINFPRIYLTRTLCNCRTQV